MKLYYSPAACSLSPHIALRAAGMAVELIKVDLKSKQTQDGRDFYQINPKGSVPCLELDNGERITEGPAIVQYIADLNPAANLAPANGTFARTRLQEWLNFITSELHKGFSPLFNPQAPAEWKTLVRATLGKKLDVVSHHLAAQPYLLGDQFSVADGYLFTVLFWTRWVEIDLQAWPVLHAYFQRIATLPAVAAALEAEGVKA
ncbi:glutathione transferase GstA [Parvibium lacunae]|uniref:Glutathione transferase GstA n=1 Tax=Parvibium lacunae TaxID=1888893 RepID=A0A368L3B3_9BURK|nr:glutathione transferase GstA [Parvibium lacunae]RCS58081.1 glutathione transferase GstA [Parvibium lacunae]